METPQNPSAQVGQATRNFLESSPQRVTPQDAERARQEKRAAHIKLMDDMEGSIATQGQYFTKIGQKKPITETRQGTTGGILGIGKKPVEHEEVIGYEDDRALILKAHMKGKQWDVEREEFTVVTPDGIFVIPFHTTEIENPQDSYQRDSKKSYDTLVAFTTGMQVPSEKCKYGPREHTRPQLEIVPQEGSWPTYIQLEEFPDERKPNLMEEFQHVVGESIRMTESPHKQNFESATAQAKVAVEASTFVKGLPPRE